MINGDQGYVMMGNNKQPLPADQIEESVKDMDRELLFIAKGGGSANKSFLFQETKALLNPSGQTSTSLRWRLYFSRQAR